MQRAALRWTLVWVGLSALFCAGVAVTRGSTAGLEWLTGYVIEKALSVDNLFVFYVIFRWFAVPPERQGRLLAWGVLGALVLRLAVIAAGAALLERFHALAWALGAFLVFTGVQMARHDDAMVKPGENPVVRAARRFHVPEWLVVICAIESTDLVFAMDSIPATFAVTTDPFLVYTSNIFAVLGLRAMYFLLAGSLARFPRLKDGLAAILILVGAKMLVSRWVAVPVWITLSAVALILYAAIRKSRPSR